ncbi:hypothetical protein [Cellulomonas sp. WB94]|nr:hypothetical protein [Cellulomonas sp. WB94]
MAFSVVVTTTKKIENYTTSRDATLTSSHPDSTVGRVTPSMEGARSS